MTDTNATRPATIAEARSEWSKARPATAMAVLARAGSDMTDRRAILRSWGVSFDDQIDFSSDRFLADAGYGPDGAEIHTCCQESTLYHMTTCHHCGATGEVMNDQLVGEPVCAGCVAAFEHDADDADEPETCSCGSYGADDEPGHTFYDCVPAPCSYTGCSGHYRALGLAEQVWCDVHAGLGAALAGESQLPQRYVVTVNVKRDRGDGWTSTFQLPTFYLDAATQGIVSEEHAAGIARTIVDNMHVSGATYNITAVAL